MSETGNAGGSCSRGGNFDEFDAGSACAQVIAEVWTLLDGECTPENRDRLRQHLEACSECFEHYGIELRIKELISIKCSGETAPDGLRDRLRLEFSRTTIIREEA